MLHLFLILFVSSFSLRFFFFLKSRYPVRRLRQLWTVNRKANAYKNWTTFPGKSKIFACSTSSLKEGFGYSDQKVTSVLVFCERCVIHFSEIFACGASVIVTKSGKGWALGEKETLRKVLMYLLEECKWVRITLILSWYDSFGFGSDL